MSDKAVYLAAFNYASGLLTPRVTSSWLIKNKFGVLVWLPLQLLTMFIITVPCLFMELALGQYSNKAVIRVWDLCPILRGVGISSFITFIVYQMYYNFYCTYALLFTVLSLRNRAEWKTCNNSWNTINCYTRRDWLTRRYECSQKLSKEKCDQMEWHTSVDQFFYNRILNLSDSSGQFGIRFWFINHYLITILDPQYELLLYTLITMVLIFLISSSGSRVLEKILVILTIIPTLQMIILFFTTLSHSTGLTSVVYALTMQTLSRLKRIDVWMVMVDIASSGSGLGFGAYITLGTQGSFRTPLHFKSVLISFLVVLSILGYTAVVENFIVSLCIQSKMLFTDFLDLQRYLPMPEAVFFMTRAKRFWITMWLSNKYILGLRSLIVMMLLNVEIFCNSLPKAKKHYTLCVFMFCTIIYSGGIFVSMRSAYLVVEAIDETICTIVLPFLTACEMIAVIYCYGVTNFEDDVHFMLGIRLPLYWKILYCLNPILLTAKCVYNIKIFYDRSNKHKHQWVYIYQQFVLWFSIVFIASYALFYVIKVVARKNFNICKPSQNWGPAQSELHKSRQMFTAHSMTKEYVYRQERFGLNQDQQGDEDDAE
ncbi:sodium-dependent noradrenaline transporter-like [Asbolus verrucosus]|uniref:Sodium-dependent noradrenaline transporter-like n=1 Tax=Asbolus verrucosus TaxID=1661398 RepID=A0A482VS58_ASBVE|nr:sodium-dependent noradrenaline transporter-like [Asbolus verrucosus]